MAVAIPTFRTTVPPDGDHRKKDLYRHAGVPYRFQQGTTYVTLSVAHVPAGNPRPPAPRC